MHKENESGRSLVEMLGVLGLISLVSIGSVFLINGLFKYYKEKETVKQMNTIVSHYRSDKLMRKRDGKVMLKDIVPGAQLNSLRAADGGSFTLQDNGNTFIVIKKANLETASCNDILQEGRYNVVGYGSTPTGYLAPETVYSVDTAKLNSTAICNPENYQYFYFNKDDKAGGNNFVVNGELSECPNAGETKDSKGDCCLNTQKTCGTCGGCKKPTPYCAGEVCVECTEDGHCPGGFCVNNQCVECKDVGQLCTGTWPANTYCNSTHECETCQAPCKAWNGYTCVDNPKKELNEFCSVNCECITDNCENGRCKQAGQCTTDDRMCQDRDGNCICCSPKTRWDEGSNKCECPLGYDYDNAKKQCVKGDDLVCPTTGVKGDSCSAYTSYPNGCCGTGLYCKNGTCECKTISKNYKGECNTTCGCDSDELICRGEKKMCLCPLDKPQFNTATGKCEQCPADKPLWDDENLECVECLQHTDCKDNHYCNFANHTCVECAAPTQMCSISEEEHDEKGCPTKVPFKCPRETDTSDKTICKDGTTCVECTSSLDCPENEFCTSNNTCAPCGPTRGFDTTLFTASIRGKTEPKCGCPEETTIYCGSTSAGYSKTCVEGNYICRMGCQQTSDCDANKYCYKEGTANFGTCKPCGEGEFRKSEETECHACEGCQTLNETQDGCVSTCQEDEACIMRSCTATSTGGTCQITPANGTWTCQKKPALKTIVGATVGGKFYLPPAETQYRFYQPDAARFCESYGYRLATIQEACGKDWAYDSGYDCKNISSHNLSQYYVTGMGSFWMDARYGSYCTSLTTTYSCGNNHEHGVCTEKFYPLCTDGSKVKCSKNEQCPENFYCSNSGCQKCSEDGSAIRKQSDKSCHCKKGEVATCEQEETTCSDENGNTIPCEQKEETQCKEGNFVCTPGCHHSSDCEFGQYCSKDEGETLGECKNYTEHHHGKH